MANTAQASYLLDLRSSLDTFIAASQYAVFNMTIPPRAKHPITFFGRFKCLPVEIRYLIYQCIFNDAHLILDFAKTQTIGPRGKIKLQRWSLEDTITAIRGNKGALLIASEFCRREALEILASQATTLESQGDWPGDGDAVAIVDHRFLKYIKVLTTTPSSFLRADKTLFPSLKQVCLTADLKSHQTFGGFLNLMTCRQCGESDGLEAYQTFAIEEGDWEWKSRQIWYLAKEACFQVCIKFYQNYPEVHDNCWGLFELEGVMEEDAYDSYPDVLPLTKRLVQNGKTILWHQDFDDCDATYRKLGIYEFPDDGWS